ncbi:histidine decarboxylase [Paramecium bursaria Chlorella virus NYs1]|uniref:Histidine decarboxylase n=1 Tax=Paramecium bursaria Chlorella virus NYs1 TaxID=83442 RepID=M1HHW7_9PHYC|nr:histidine decarboxylase [Paramecium bursaria Chlorella virus NYs1]AGE55081.1 histidine decarboxylase [Paramecium bursaria Chlorella virus MA1D]AGE58898.1 histidine decarboxylase [Paramecium bursaria Chlorella virus NYs1]
MMHIINLRYIIIILQIMILASISTSRSNVFVHRHVKKIAIGYPCTLNRNFKKVVPSLEHSLNNAGCPFENTGTFDRARHDEERHLIMRIADMWNVDTENIWGYTTSGGSEGNLEGLYIAREKYPDGILYATDQIHYSIKKIAKLLRMKFVVVPSDKNGAMDICKFDSILDKTKPAIVLANIGSTFVGGVDDVEQIHNILKRNGMNFYIHADAAFYGFIMKYLRPGFCDYVFYDSISVSCHKFPGVPFPSGIFMCVKKHVDHINNFEEVIRQRDITISGSRNGHTSIFMNYFFDTVDIEKDVEDCLVRTEYLFERLREAVPECTPWKNDRSIIVVFKQPSDEIIMKWSLATVQGRSHVVVLNHVSKDIIDAFVHDMAMYFGRR